MSNKSCSLCGEIFFSRQSNYKYCDECRQEHKRRYSRERMRRLRADPVIAETLRDDSRRYARKRRATDAEYNAMELERLKAWKEDNPEKVKAKNRIAKRRREHLGQQLEATLTPAEWDRTLEYFEWACAYCGADGELHQEHFIPVSRGGGYTKENILPACPVCNQSKSDTLPQEWLPEDTYAEVSAYLVKG